MAEVNILHIAVGNITMAGLLDGAMTARAQVKFTVGADPLALRPPTITIDLEIAGADTQSLRTLEQSVLDAARDLLARAAAPPAETVQRIWQASRAEQATWEGP